MINNQNIRSYEVSIWTLQDSFITILKSLDLEYKGQIEEPKLTLKEDSVDTFSFKIPMYIDKNGKFIENPNWYNVINGVLLANMRKVKVIMNKYTPAEKIFEFIITKVTETHSGFEKTCEVECEALAFHELGKRGYKINLSLETVEYDQEQDSTTKNNIAYWVDKVLSNTSWTAEYHFNQDEDEEILYEDAYARDWEEAASGMLKPVSIEQKKEKERIVEASESNCYNITQDIAEAFGVYCDYVYEYDADYHICARKVRFYDNFFKEEQEVIDITYHYDTTDLSREMDSTEITTKMFVTGSTSDDGYNNSIMNLDANPTLEDYLLNFDYLYTIGAITKGQYNQIPAYKAKLREYNKQLITYSNVLTCLQQKIIEYESKRDTYAQMVKDDLDTANIEKNYITTLLGEGAEKDIDTILNSMKEWTKENPAIIVGYKKSTDDSSIYFDFREDHYDIQIGSINIYAAGTLTDESNPIFSDKSDTCEYIYSEDKLHYIVGIKINDGASNLLGYKQATYAYRPAFYHYQLLQQYEEKQKKDANKQEDYTKLYKILAEYDDNENLKGGLIYICQNKINELQEEKQNLINKFENMMGPALREGTWQPEDDYGKYYTTNSYSGQLKKETQVNLSQPILYWDTVPFESETVDYEEVGVEREPQLLPLLRMTQSAIDKIKNHFETNSQNNKNTINDLALIFKYAYVEKQEATENTPEVEEKAVYINYTLNSDLIPVFYSLTKIRNEQGVYEERIPFSDAISYGFLIQDSNNKNGIKLENNETLIHKLASFTWGNKVECGLGYYEKIEENDEITIGKDPIYIIPSNEFEAYGIGFLTQEEDNGHRDYVKILYPRLRIPYQTFMSESVKTISYTENSSYYELEVDKHFFITNRLDIYDTADNEFLTPKNELSFYQNIKDDGIEVLKQSAFNYYITIRPDVFYFKPCKIDTTFNINYKLYNTALMIYLDAQKILQENSQPKVTYEVTPAIIKPDFYYNLYERMHQLAHINDPELHFENVMGYISEIEMDLDKPSEDSISIKNYKTKFEDLFTEIIAQSQQMKKNSYVMSAAASIFNGDKISVQAVNQTLEEKPVMYSLKNGAVKINETQGIQAISEDGIVSYSDTGIFTSNKKDDNGDWIWNTGITPSGINATSITTGRLNTQLIRIYSGQDLRFQWNGDGLYAYKGMANENGEAVDSLQHVVYNSEGLFLIGEKGLVYDQSKEPLQNAVKRVEVSWDGLKLRNWNNEEVFYADPDTGNLTIKGSFEVDTTGTFKVTSKNLIINPNAKNATEILDNSYFYVGDDYSNNNTNKNYIRYYVDTSDKSTLEIKGNVETEGLVFNQNGNKVKFDAGGFSYFNNNDDLKTQITNDYLKIKNYIISHEWGNNTGLFFIYNQDEEG